MRRELDRRAQAAELPDVARKLVVDPASITKCVVRDHIRVDDFGQVMDGDWDLETIRFEELDVFRSFQAHFQRGVPWRETELRQRVLARIEDGRTPWGCRSADDLDARLASLDDLYDSIDANGYKAQDELPKRQGTYWTLIDEVSVSISRSGELLFRDGRHRLSIAKLLELEAIPVQVALRHREWVDLRRMILDFADARGGRVDAPLPHPDLSDIPSVHGHARFDAIREALPIEGGRLLDAGAGWGYFCHRFESLGFDCTALEDDPVSLRFLRALREASSRAFSIYEESMLDHPLADHYDVVLAMDGFRRFREREADFDRLVEALDRLDAEAMVLGPCLPEDPRTDGLAFTPEGFAAFVAERCGLASVTSLGAIESDVPMYLLQR